MTYERWFLVIWFASAVIFIACQEKQTRRNLMAIGILIYTNIWLAQLDTRRSIDRLEKRLEKLSTIQVDGEPSKKDEK